MSTAVEAKDYEVLTKKILRHFSATEKRHQNIGASYVCFLYVCLLIPAPQGLSQNGTRTSEKSE